MIQSVFKYSALAAAVFALPLVMNISDADAFFYGKKLPSGKTCLTFLGEDHMHSGNSALARRADAEAKAIRRWSGFVSFEFGRKWGKWALGDKRTMECVRDTDKDVWRCRAEAQPCWR